MTRYSLPGLLIGALLTLSAAAPPAAARGGARPETAPPAGSEARDPGVHRTEALPSPPGRHTSRVRGFHAVPPPLEEVYVFYDSLNGLTLDDQGGWDHYDVSEQPTAWNISPVLACEGNSWWCGLVDSSWIYDSNRAGYDNDWIHYLQNSVRIDSIPIQTPIRIAFSHRFNAEPDYDFGFVEVLHPVESWTPLATYTGVEGTSHGDCDSVIITVPDTLRTRLLEDPENPIPLFFRFTFRSDLAYSSADGLYDGDGWVIDNITVRAGSNQVLFFDNCENGMGNWQRTIYPGVGDYWTLANNVATEDLCVDNRTNIWVDWDPVVLALVPRLDNWLVTPPVPVSRASEVFLAFDVYRSLPLMNCFYYHLRFRTKDVGDTDWGSWIDPTRLVYYGGQKDWARQKVTLTGAGGHDSVQVRIGLRDFGVTYCGGVSSPGGSYAHFDNVAIGIIATAPPKFTPRDLDLFQDTFSTAPFMERDDNFNTPLGDSAVIQVNVSRGYREGYMFYRLNGGPFSSVPLEASAPALPNFRFADLPPGSYPANTTVEYYFAVTDSQNTTGYYPLDAPGDQNFLSASVLPTKHATNPTLGCTDSSATILVINNNAGRETEPFVANAVRAWGFKVDTYEVNGPTSGVGNTPGGSDPADPIYHWPATDVSTLLPYSTIIWHAGNLNAFSISQQDQAFLQSWIQQPGKDRNLWITGDNVAYELAFTGAEYNSFLSFTCGMRYIRNTWENFPQDSLHPIVTGLANGPSAGRIFHVNGDCPQIENFDLIQNSSHAFLTGKAGPFLNYPNGLPAATRFATKYVPFGSDSARVVFQAFSHNNIEEGGERLQLAKSIVQLYFKESPCYVATAVEGDTPAGSAPRFSDALEQNAPNPFNPETVIGYTVSRPGRVEIRLFGPGGALVRRIAERPSSAGRHTVRWNGTDDSGRRLGSGVYFYEIETEGGYRAARKLILLK